MSQRVVIPEILDHLPADDPEARRSRRDLARINFFMGNSRWICRQVSEFPQAAMRGIVEIGAGDGALCERLSRLFPDAPVTAHDLAPPPDIRGSRVVWKQGNLFDFVAPADSGILVASLFIHHFQGAELVKLGRWMRGFQAIILCEPNRARLPHLLGNLMHPFINRVTRHDMHVSITAGFSSGELGPALGLADSDWHIRETSTWRGARRVVAWRT